MCLILTTFWDEITFGHIKWWLGADFEETHFFQRHPVSWMIYPNNFLLCTLNLKQVRIPFLRLASSLAGRKPKFSKLKLLSAWLTQPLEKCSVTNNLRCEICLLVCFRGHWIIDSLPIRDYESLISDTLSLSVQPVLSTAACFFRITVLQKKL